MLTPPPVTNGIPVDQTRLLPASEAETFQPWTSSSDATVLGPVPESEGLTRTLIPDSHTEPVNERNTAILPKPAGPRQKEGPLEIGQAFGSRYHIIKVLGVGGMGAVYQAWDAELGVSVAVKVIRPEIAADPTASAEIARRFKRELVLARQVTDRHVVRIHDLGEIDGIKYITMEYVDGSDLSTILKSNEKLPVARALRLARGIVSGLVAAHEAGVVHRDLKPANIMVGSDGEPTIMDFGIARSSGRDSVSPPPAGSVSSGALNPPPLPSDATMAGAVIGTIEYMAPEQAKGHAVDQRADVYAVGLILYDMLIGGRRSERAASAIAELQRRMDEAPAAPRTVDPQIPPEIDAIISRCLEPDPAKRFQTSADLYSAFEKLDDNGKPLPIIRRLTRRTMAAAAVVILLLLGGTFYTTKWLSAPVKEPDPVSVVIADFQNTTDDPHVRQHARADAEARSRGCQLHHRVRPDQNSVDVRRPAPDKFDQVAARELAVKQGLRYVLAGSIATRGNGYDITIQAIEPKTGNVKAVAQRRASSKDQVLATVSQIGDECSQDVR